MIDEAFKMRLSKLHRDLDEVIDLAKTRGEYKIAKSIARAGIELLEAESRVLGIWVED